jgi:2,3-bisphosphoglycerate-independent phosphoglycerate mutase
MDTHKPSNDRPLALVILDGWGYAPRTEGNAIAMAHTPYYDQICRQYPMATLAAATGDQQANAEVGHLNIGTGRAAQTEAARIKAAVASGEFMENAALVRAFSRAKEKGSAVHLIGLVSDGNIHSSTENLFALIRMAKARGLKDVFIHCILDGVDVPPRTADIYIEALEIKLADIGIGQIATLCGRFFAMDMAENWERTARAFTMLVHAEGERSRDAVTSIRNSFLRGIGDEFTTPVVIEKAPDVPMATVKSGDLAVFFNHRADGMRQLVRSLCVPEGASGAKPDIDTIGLVEYDPSFNLPAAFRQEPEKNALTEVLAANEVPNVKITEYSRFPHVTWFFNGGIDSPSRWEQQVLVGESGIRVVETPPESASFKIADKLRRSIEMAPSSVFVVNMPAAGLFAETGDIDRTMAAIQYIDTCLGGICDRVAEARGVAMITSTHGRCEQMIHTDGGEPSFYGTENPVPFHFLDFASDGVRLRDEGTLADIAPTILGLLGLEKPAEMTGSDLRVL